MKNANIEARMEALKELCDKALSEMLAIQLELSSMNHQMLAAIIEQDTQRQVELIEQVSEYDLLDPQASAQECLDAIAEVTKNFATIITEAATELPHMLNLREIVGAKKHCPSCGFELSATDEYCPDCGAHIGADRPYVEGPTIHCTTCTGCGHAYNEEFKYCPQCGAPKVRPSSMLDHYKRELDESKPPVKRRGDGL